MKIKVEKTSDGFRSKIACESELGWIEEAPDKEQQRTLLLFSAKEALYKALNPITGTYFGFSDAELEWNNNDSSFEATLMKDLNSEFKAGAKICGNALIESGLIITWVILRSGNLSEN